MPGWISSRFILFVGFFREWSFDFCSRGTHASILWTAHSQSSCSCFRLNLLYRVHQSKFSYKREGDIGRKKNLQCTTTHSLKRGGCINILRSIHSAFPSYPPTFFFPLPFRKRRRRTWQNRGKRIYFEFVGFRHRKHLFFVHPKLYFCRQLKGFPWSHNSISLAKIFLRNQDCVFKMLQHSDSLLLHWYSWRGFSAFLGKNWDIL